VAEKAPDKGSDNTELPHKYQVSLEELEEVNTENAV
jgi:hypothetical protein